MLRKLLFLVFAFTPLIATSQDPAPNTVSPASPAEISPNGVAAEFLCKNCEGGPYNPVAHYGIYTDWTEVQKEHLFQLRSAILNQDVWHQMESKAHFDNCDFVGATGYIQTLMTELEQLAKTAQDAEKKNDIDGRDGAVRKSYKVIGQILHGIQDFYSHPNDVELVVQRIKNKEISAANFDSHTIDLFTADALTQLKELEKKGLVSGVVSWGFPKKCAPNAASHGDLAKDSDKGHGAVKVPELGNKTLHSLSYSLAKHASKRFMYYAWEEWSVLDVGKSRDRFPLDVMIDRRQ